MGAMDEVDVRDAEWRTAVDGRPQLTHLKTFLVSRYPGTRFQRNSFIAAELPEQVAEALRIRGVLREGKGTVRRGEDNACHTNTEKLARKINGTCWFGLALHRGVWRVHSWVVTKTNKLVETTVKAEIYFGLTF